MSKKPQELFDVNGNPLNPYIPRFISNKPWYNDQDTTDDLSHQRLEVGKVNDYREPRIGDGITDNFKVSKETKRHKSRNGKISKSSKVTKGCANCGSDLHSTKECFEKPRKLKNRVTEEQSHTDVRVRQVDDWDSKRDRWFGYDVDEYKLKDFQSAAVETALGSEEEDELEELRSLGLEPEKLGSRPDVGDTEGKIGVRGLDEKASYIDGIKRGEEVRYDPRTRKVQDDLADDGMFIKAKDAEQFEKDRRFNVDVSKYQ
ncbi:unnamed protein product [Kuraishia capsulata CBS 1993]|uniref:Pre-mRNA-splicing factor SLU7 n=1 Tax=Kuraishia capsulata CBS 1993 TaxID=1382522 RepID=W6MF31_9ASCO|nr:uncharacterized protein KUCA_T00000139001 [Kuraishia capsulata CBS 1993]CDK24179.1 unnamed protein product [Kuraishia capsulata CBS 1993]